jgi:hypothetical protein
MSSVPPCYTTFSLAGATIGFLSGAFILGIIKFSLFSYTLHKNPNKTFSSNTKYDIESSAWVIVLSALGAGATSLSVLINYNCPNCTAAELTCVTQSGQYGATLVAAITAFCSAALGIASYFHQMYIAKSVGGTVPNDESKHPPDIAS